MMKPLLAKSIPPWAVMQADVDAGPAAWTLVGHTRNVLAAAHALFGSPGAVTRLARSWLRFFGLEESDHPRFLRHLRIAAAGHDWGKANQGFQAVVARRGEQTFRHEHLSVLLLSDAAIVEWLRGAGVDAELVLAAILAHHVKAGRSGTEDGDRLQVAFEPMGRAAGRNFEVIESGHPDFLAVRDMIAAEVGSPFPTSVEFRRAWGSGEITRRADYVRKLFGRFEDDVAAAENRRRLLVAVRAALIVADAAGSAEPRMGMSLDEWIATAFRKELDPEQDIEDGVIQKRFEQLKSRDPGMEFNEFQKAIAGQGPRVLMQAPCGSGKTLAAWNWIKARLTERPAARVLFLYPTRATATEGFRDYVSWAPEDDAGFLSGTADYELDGMFGTTEDERQGRDYRDDPRLFALGHWRKRIFSATADQFFPFLQYAYGSLCMLPVLVESIVVVDEVHSFDASMYSTLKHFLNEFPTVPVLCMTATLPKERRDDLERLCGLTPFPRKMPEDLAKVARHPRYEIRWIDADQVEAVTRAALDARKRVLRVCNRVDDCRAAFEAFRDVDLLPDEEPTAFCYHSRFKLHHRQDRHKAVVDAFKPKRDGTPSMGVYAATTQVCEMSLDLDADVLITDVAPISSLIQRMGRCNRDLRMMFNRPPGVVYVVRRGPGSPRPYEEKELLAAEAFIDELVEMGKAVSQETLETAYVKYDPQESEMLKHCRFLCGDPYASSTDESFRDIDEYTVPCVLDDDVAKVVQAIKAKGPIDGFRVPVPMHVLRREGAADPGKNPDLPRYLRIAPGRLYDDQSGYDGRFEPCNEGEAQP